MTDTNPVDATVNSFLKGTDKPVSADTTPPVVW